MGRKRKRTEEELEPTEKIISDGDLLKKNLLQKQLCKHTSLQHELQSKKEFVSRAEYVPVSNFVSGMNSLGSFKDESEYYQTFEELSAAGLNKEDVDFYLDSKKGMDELRLKHKNLSYEVIESRLKDIYHLIDNLESKTDETNKSDKLSRHQTEFMLSIKPNSIETTLLKFALNNEKNSEKKITSMDIIQTVEKDFMSSLENESEPNISKIRKKARALNNRISSIKFEMKEPERKKQLNSELFEKNSKWDNKNEYIQIEPRSENKTKSYGCEVEAKKKLYTLKDGVIIPIHSQINQPIEKELKKLTLGEIRALPKFVDYNPGNPSNVLFLKNLPKASDADVAVLFEPFKSEIKLLRMMSGRMKGQAFIEMSNTEVAQKALDEINGTIIKNKPIIIQFGKKKEAEYS